MKDDVTTETSEHEDRSTARVSMTCMCMQESMCQSVWGYAVKQKGAGEERLVAQIADDIGTIGLAKERMIVKRTRSIPSQMCRKRSSGPDLDMTQRWNTPMSEIRIPMAEFKELYMTCKAWFEL